MNIKTVIFCNDRDAPAQKFSDEFIYGKSEKRTISKSLPILLFKLALRTAISGCGELATTNTFNVSFLYIKKANYTICLYG